MTATARTCTALMAILPALLAIPEAPAQEVRWRGNYAAARREAVARDRPLVIDFGTESCFWCKQLDQRTFSDASVAGALNDHFILLKIDAQREAELVDKLRIRSYPTIVIASSDGVILDTIEGFREASVFSEHLQRALGNVPAPEWMKRDYQEAARLVAASDHAKAHALLRKIVEDGKERPVQVQARQLLQDVEQHQAGRREPRVDPRTQRARELILQAKDDYRSQQFLCCLERCEHVAANFSDLPEGAEAHLLALQIKNNPEWLRQACEALGDRLGVLYLSLAESWLKNGQPHQAVIYLERVLQNFPGTRHAEAAQTMLFQVQGQPTQSADPRNP